MAGKRIVDPSLKACPHCGGRPRLVVTKYREISGSVKEPATCYVWCTVCGSRTKDFEDTTGSTPEEQTDKEAVKLATEHWNMRAHA